MTDQTINSASPARDWPRRPDPLPTEQVSADELYEHLFRAAIRANTGHVDVLIDSFVASLRTEYSITRSHATAP